MTSQLPGYTGYLPRYEREFVVPTLDPVPATKYVGYAEQKRELLDDSPWMSMYRQKHGAKSAFLPENFQGPAKPAAAAAAGGQITMQSPSKASSSSSSLPTSSSSSASSGPAPAAAPPHVAASLSSTSYQPFQPDQRPTYWNTTYAGTFDAWRTFETQKQLQKVEAQFEDPSAFTNPNLKDLSDDPFVHNKVLRNVEMKSTHQLDFGMRGSNPRQRLADPVLAATQTPVTVVAGATAGSAPAAASASLPAGSAAATTTTFGGGEGGVQYQQQVRDNLKFISSSLDMHQGTTKATKYGVPGYSGFIPASKRNQSVAIPANREISFGSPTSSSTTTTAAGSGADQQQQQQEQQQQQLDRQQRNFAMMLERVKIDTKDNLRAIYRHNVPGYTGHQPRAAMNDRGERNPATKVAPPAVYSSLMLKSMYST